MFKELAPYLRQRAVLLTVTHLEEDQIRVNIIPQKLKDGDNNALTTPLSVTGTAEELDRELPATIVDFVAAHLQLKNTLDKAKAEMERARQKARLFGGSSAESVTQGFTLRAPIDGEVIARNVNPGAEVQGQYGGGTAVELFTIGELDQVWVFADIFEMDLARVHQGAAVTVKAIAYPDEVFTGKVDWIAGALDPISRTARIRCTIPNPRRELKPEMYVTVSIAVVGPSVAALPRTAVLRIADQTAVFVASGATPDGRLKFIRRIVAINEDQGADYLPIVRGLAPGDRIVTTGATLLSGML